MATIRKEMASETTEARQVSKRRQVRLDHRQAIAALNKQLAKFDSVLGVGFDRLESPEGTAQNETGLIVFIDPSLKEDLERLKKVMSSSYAGYRVMMRPPRTSFKVYYDYLKKNGVDNPERFDCIPDPFWLDPVKIHHMVQRHAHKPAGEQPKDPATAVFGEIFVIEDDGSLVSNPGTGTETVDYMAIFNRFRMQFGDHYDFAYIHHDTASGLNGGGGVSPTIFNDIIGINHYQGDAFNGRAGWNTTKLQSYQAVRSFQMRRMLHETAHRWLAYVNHREGGAVSDNLHEDLITNDPVQGRFHWGNWYDDENSCMDYDYFDWVDTAGGYQHDSLTAGNAAVDEFRYTAVDLYLMGLIPATEVSGFRYLENPQDVNNDGVFTATPHALTVNNIIDQHGARNPDAASAQRVFHQAFILLTRNLAGAGNLTTGVVQEFDQWRRDFEQRFREAAQGRAVIDTRLLHDNFSSLYIRDNMADNGTVPSTGATWNSPDIWVRQNDDGGTDHEQTIRTRDNFLRARVWNSSGANYDDVTVRFYIGNHAENLPGTDFLFPEDWRMDRFLGEAVISVPAGGSAIAGITWAAATIPPATGWHPCLLVEVLPLEVTPSALHRREASKKLAQKNISIVDPPADPADSSEFRFIIGRPHKRSKGHILLIDRVEDIPQMRIMLAAGGERLELLPEFSQVTGRPGIRTQPPTLLKPSYGSRPVQTTGNQIFIPAGTQFGYSLAGENWTTLKFNDNTVVELKEGLPVPQESLTILNTNGILYHALPAWYRTAVRVPANPEGVQIISALINDPTGQSHNGKQFLVSFMEYEAGGRLVGGVDYCLNG